MFLEGSYLHIHTFIHSYHTTISSHLPVRAGGERDQEERDAGHQAEHRDWLGAASLHHPLQHVLRVRELRGHLPLLAADGQGTHVRRNAVNVH